LSIISIKLAANCCDTPTSRRRLGWDSRGCLIEGKNATLGGFKYSIPHYKLKSVPYAKTTALLEAVSSC
jgi:hypothetical protein